MFRNAEVFQLFPTCVWRHEVAEAARLNEQLMQALTALRATTAPRNNKLGFWQSQMDLHTMPAFQGLTDTIVAGFKGVMDYLEIERQGLTITNCWANVAPPGASHHHHTHPNNLLSGVYYVRIPDGAARIVFEDPRPQAHIMIPAYKRYTPQNSAQHPFDVTEGQMLIFPSWLSHLVETHKSDVERVSIAFNAVPKGRLGYDSGLLEL